MDFEEENRLHRLEQKIDFLLQELGLTEKEEASRRHANPQLTEVITLLKQNNKLGAIALYRRQMGVGLKEAKEAVEKLIY